MPSLPACREAVFGLTGILLPEDAPLEDYAHTLALIRPGEHKRIQTVTDVINLLEKVQPSHAFKDEQNGTTASWQDVHEQIAQGEGLYSFDKKTHEVIEDWGTYAARGTLTKEELHKHIAASVLLMGDIFDQETQLARHEKMMEEGTWYESPH